MKIKNKHLNEINRALINLGNKQQIKERFELTKIAYKFKEANEIVSEQIDQIIQKRHAENEKITSISKSDKEYIELMNCSIDIDFDGISLSEISNYNPSTEELVCLMPIIKE